MGLCASCINDGSKKTKLSLDNITEKVDHAYETETNKIRDLVSKFKELENSDELGCNIGIVVKVIYMTNHLKKYRVLQYRLESIRLKSNRINSSTSTYVPGYPEYFGSCCEFSSHMRDESKKVIGRLKAVSEECDKIQSTREHITYSEFDDMYNLLSAYGGLPNDKIITEISERVEAKANKAKKIINKNK